MRPEYRPYLIRLLVVLGISLAAMLVVVEGAYLLQRDETDRGPKTIQIVVPAGAAERVANGEMLEILPESTVFVIGDVLEVVNQDSHRSPAGTNLGASRKHAAGCSGRGQ